MNCVFLVDGDKRLTKAVAKALAAPGYTVKTFTHPKEAIPAFIENVPAVVVT
mgnify:FL=1